MLQFQRVRSLSKGEVSEFERFNMSIQLLGFCTKTHGQLVRFRPSLMAQGLSAIPRHINPKSILGGRMAQCSTSFLKLQVVQLLELFGGRMDRACHDLKSALIDATIHRGQCFKDLRPFDDIF